MNPAIVKARQHSRGLGIPNPRELNKGEGLIEQITRETIKSWLYPSEISPYHWVNDEDTWYTPKYVDLSCIKELATFGKDQLPYIPIRGSILGDCIQMKHLIWQNGMTYDHFRRYVLKVKFEYEKDMSYLEDLFSKLNIV